MNKENKTKSRVRNDQIRADVVALFQLGYGYSEILNQLAEKWGREYFIESKQPYQTFEGIVARQYALVAESNEEKAAG